ncbi:MAG: AMIN domain-containing protein, partial [Bdellovibrionales bacterium]|nr:AMIN domain-containing protein [Bdellovibrionales bacterium]
MTLSTVFRRVFAVTFVLSITAIVVSCTNRNSTQLEPDLTAVNQSEASSEASSEANTAIALANSPVATSSVVETDLAAEERMSVATRILSAPGADMIGIELAEAKTFNQLTINTDTDRADYKVVRLQSPPRIVIDVLNQQARINRIFDTQDMEYISGVRIGAHPDKSRIVLDLAGNDSLLHNVDAKGGAIVITVASEANMPEALAYSGMSTNQNFDSAEGSPVMARFSADENTNDQFANNTNNETNNVVAASLPEVSNTGADFSSGSFDSVSASDTSIAAPNTSEKIGLTQPVLKGLQIKPAGEGENYLVAEMESAGIFSLTKTAPSEYVVTIEKATVDQSVTPVLAAPKSGEIRSVRPVVEGDNVQLRIFVNAGSKLTATTENGNVIIAAALPGEEIELEDVRAQFSENEIQGSGNSNPNEEEIAALFADQPKYSGRLISLDLQDTDIDNALRIIAEVSNLNIIASEDVAGKVTLRLIDVPWD